MENWKLKHTAISIFHFQLLQKVSHQFPFGAEVGGVFLFWFDDKRLSAHNFYTCIFDGLDLKRVVCEQADLADAKVVQYLHSEVVMPWIYLETEVGIGGSGIEAVVLKVVRF